MTKNLEKAATQFLRSKGFNSSGQPIKPKTRDNTHRSKPAGPYIRIVSVPMGGMTRRTW
jgi:hypothetical protein